MLWSSQRVLGRVSFILCSLPPQFPFSRTDPETNKTTTDMITYHGCEKDLDSTLESNVGVICDGHTNACYNVSKDDIVDEFLTEATACFCDGDR